MGWGNFTLGSLSSLLQGPKLPSDCKPVSLQDQGRSLHCNTRWRQQPERWPAVSVVAGHWPALLLHVGAGNLSPKDSAACIISWAISLEFQLHPACLLAKARLYSPIFWFPSGSRGPNTPSFHRQSWSTAQRTCTSSATAWEHTWLGKQAGGWRATWAGSQVGVLRTSLKYEGPQGVGETCQCLSYSRGYSSLFLLPQAVLTTTLFCAHKLL